MATQQTRQLAAQGELHAIIVEAVESGRLVLGEPDEKISVQVGSGRQLDPDGDMCETVFALLHLGKSTDGR